MIFEWILAPHRLRRLFQLFSESRTRTNEASRPQIDAPHFAFDAALIGIFAQNRQLLFSLRSTAISDMALNSRNTSAAAAFLALVLVLVGTFEEASAACGQTCPTALTTAPFDTKMVC
jgi:hypothetical protein